MCACHRRARKVSWLFSEHLPPRACGLLTQRDATGRPWRQPRMGVRRRPRAARPEWASGFEVCPHLLRALFAVVPCWRKAQCVAGRQSLPCHNTVEGTEWELWRTKTGWVIYLAPFAGRATLQLLRRALLGPTRRPLKPRCRGISGLGQLSGKSSARGSAPTGFLRRHRRGRGVGVAQGTPTHSFDLHIAS